MALLDYDDTGVLQRNAFNAPMVIHILPYLGPYEKYYVLVEANEVNRNTN